MHRSPAGAPAALAPRAPRLVRFARKAVAPRAFPRRAVARRAVPRRAFAPLVLPLMALALLGGCTSPTTTPRPTDIAATPTPVPGATTPPGTTPTAEPFATLRPGQVDTDWGPIWETVPAGFPVLAGAQPAEADAVVSAAYTIPTSSFPNARAVADEYARRLAEVYGGGINGPFEDGSYETWASNGYGCDIRVIAVPRGSEEVYVTVLFGALCPFEWPDR